MLYSSADAQDLVLCAAPQNGKIRFITDNWTDPSSERVSISKEGLQVKDSDIYIEDATKGVIMTAPNGQCWRMTVSNTGQPVFSSVVCPKKKHFFFRLCRFDKI